MEIQVNKEFYNFDRYVSIDRWSSYYYQIKCLSYFKAKTILLIGVGDSILASILKNLSGGGYNITTFDFDEELNPDIVGSVDEIDKLVKTKYDVIICCQVLEHLPFSKFENIISQFSKISDNVILSLPKNKITLCNVKMWLPKIHTFGFEISIRKFWKKFDKNNDGYGEHYWEVGIKNCKKKNIRMILNKYYNVLKEFNPIENKYHIFYVMSKNSSN